MISYLLVLDCVFVSVPRSCVRIPQEEEVARLKEEARIKQEKEAEITQALEVLLGLG